jgi:hypothetical protein
MDFTLTKYRILLDSLVQQGYSFQTFEEFLSEPAQKAVILRHDVDKRPLNSLVVARIENELNIRASYHFRISQGVFDNETVEQIVLLKHEIGYHYEDLNHAVNNSESIHKKNDSSKGFLLETAFNSFQKNLDSMRKYYPVKVISMHGQPMSKFDNRLIWKYYDYRDEGIICEPYFDIDYSKVLYLTDTGRKWKRDKANLRDRYSKIKDPNDAVSSSFSGWKVIPPPGSALNMTARAKKFQSGYSFRSTSDIVRAIKSEKFPLQVIISTHPQRWTGKLIPWLTELVWQNIKNVGKYFLAIIRETGVEEI